MPPRWDLLFFAFGSTKVLLLTELTNETAETIAFTMKTCIKTLSLVAGALALAGIGRAGDNITGKWKGQFDSQIGLQKYTYEFKVAGTNLTGKAIGEREMGTNEVDITEGTVSTNGIFFVEPLKFGDNELRIEYTGKVSGDEIKFHRKVGDFAEEDFVAKRVKSGEAKPAAQPETKPDTNSPPAKLENLKRGKMP
jgi:hypothetical protein